MAQERPELVPLSIAQQRMWFLNRFDASSGVDNIPVAIRLTGELDIAAMQAALGDVFERHEILRTVYPEIDGVGYQQLMDVERMIPDLSPVRIHESVVIDRVAGVILPGFDVTHEASVRAQLFDLGESEYVLVFVVHHISGDGFSMGPLIRDFVSAYVARSQGQSPQWEPLPVQYADFALWQRQILGSEDDAESVISEQVRYWQERLAGIPVQLDLPTDRPVRASSRTVVRDTAFRSTPMFAPVSIELPVRSTRRSSWWCTAPSRLCSRGCPGHRTS